MKHIISKSAFKYFIAVLLLMVGTIQVFAQYQMVVHTDDGLSYPFSADRIDSVSFVLMNLDDNGNDEDETTVTGTASEITTYTATITSWANILDNLSTDLKVGIIFTTTGTPNKNNGTQKTVNTSSIGSDAKYTIKLTDLAPSTTYYYRSFVYQSGIWFYGDVKNFTTQGQGVVSGEVSKLTCYSAKVGGSISVDESTQYSTLTYGICYGTVPVPTVNNTKVQANSKDQNGNFVCQLRALVGSTTYYYRSFVYVDNHLTYGTIRSFTTKADDVVTTGDIDTESFTVKSALKIGSGAYSTLELGICYGTNKLPTVSDQFITVNEVDDDNNFTLSLKDIPFGTVYYRAFVKIDDVAHYGEVYSFEGNEITTGKIDNTYRVKSKIKLNQSFYSNTVTYGICYGNNENPTVNNQTATTNTVYGDNNFTLLLKDIPFGIAYYRAFVAINGVVHYGEVYSFEGNEITTGEIDDAYCVKSNIKFNQSFYTKTVTYGICYGNNENPTVSNQTVTTNSVDGENNFTLTLKDIPFEMVYYRAFVAINGVVHYGEIYSYEGNAITTGEIDSTYSVKSNIRLNQSFYYTKTVTYGICYGNNENPTVSNQTVTTNSVDGENNFTLTLKDIPFGTVYYRAFVKIDGVAHYGEVYSYEGNAITTGEIDSTYSVKSNIRINQSFYTKAVTYGVCYGNNENPTVKDWIVSTNEVDDENDFTFVLKDISFGTVYYRAFVKIDGVAYYGEVCSFDGNKITTGNIDDSYSVKSSIKINQSFYTKTVTYGVSYGNNENPTANDRIVTTSNVDDENNYTLVLKVRDIPFGTVVYYRAFVKIDGVAHYGETKSFRKKLNENGSENGYQFIELGLSVRWATYNVGATKPEEYGDYFAWGETETYYEAGYAQENPQAHWKDGKTSGYTWTNYKFRTSGGSDDNVKFSKYNTSSRYGTIDYNTTLDLEDDVAHVQWGGSWRMPTKAELDDLYTKCEWKWYEKDNTEFNGVAGYKVTSNIEGYTDRFIFLPASKSGSNGFYWSSSLYTDRPIGAWYIGFGSGNVGTHGDWRNSGNSVRPVCE